MTDALRLVLTAAAQRYALPPAVVVRMGEAEMLHGSPWSFRPEHHYRWFWNVRTGKPFRALSPDEVQSKIPPVDFPSLTPEVGTGHEWWGQQVSWGPMQVMGAVARERGFRGLFLSELSDPGVGAEYGCRHLAAYLRASGGDIARAVAMYNGGPGGWRASGPQAYARKVMTGLSSSGVQV